MKTLAFILGLVLGSVLVINNAIAQQVCGERKKVVDKLGSEYKEAVAGMGLVNNGSVVEVFASEGGSWTILVTQPNGTACVVATGEAWENHTVHKASLGDPA